MGLEIPKEVKAKVAIINEDGDVLTLRRSQDEESRRGESDWAGGTIDEGETILQGLFREVEVEELPGTHLIRETVQQIYMKSKVKDGVIVETHLFAAVARHPEGGFVLSPEHDHAENIPRAGYSDVDIPNKYKTGLILGEDVIDMLVELQQNGSLEPEPVLIG